MNKTRLYKWYKYFQEDIENNMRPGYSSTSIKASLFFGCFGHGTVDRKIYFKIVEFQPLIEVNGHYSQVAE